jgi:hypothetical protein
MPERARRARHISGVRSHARASAACSSHLRRLNDAGRTFDRLSPRTGHPAVGSYMSRSCPRHAEAKFLAAVAARDTSGEPASRTARTIRRPRNPGPTSDSQREQCPNGPIGAVDIAAMICQRGSAHGRPVGFPNPRSACRWRADPWSLHRACRFSSPGSSHRRTTCTKQKSHFVGGCSLAYGFGCLVPGASERQSRP